MLDTLQQEFLGAAEAYRTAVQRDEAAGRTSASDEALQLGRRVLAVRQAFSEGLREIEMLVDIPEAFFEAIEAVKAAEQEERYWLSDVHEASATDDLDALATDGLAQLSTIADPLWLDEQARKNCRLDDELLRSPLHLVGSIRIGSQAARPQRLAQMLLVTADHLQKVDRLDFFEAPMLVAEVAALGTRLRDVEQLGSEAVEKLRRLPHVSNDRVAADVYELLVGVAARRNGLNAEMLAASKSGKTPDFRINDFAVPASIECKRRLGLSKYEVDEATHIAGLYESVREELSRAHTLLNVTFTDPVLDVDAVTFRRAVLAALTAGDGQSTNAAWGNVKIEVLRYTQSLSRTRAFAPDFMDAVFGWRPNEDWDGISCEIDAPASHVVVQVRNPRGLRWVSTSSVAMLKKARGITSLWADAMKQIPGGDMGFIYIAYPEVRRREIADARTREIIDACSRWEERWSISMGETVVNRLYPRCIGVGVPDFIESALPIVSAGEDYLTSLMPSCVFTSPSREQVSNGVEAARQQAVAALIDRLARL
jgi:hypothetical protein